MPSPSRGGRRPFVVVSAVALPAGLVGLLASFVAAPPAGKGAAPARPVRVPWTTSRVVGSPDPPPPFKVVRAFPNLKFKQPLLMARCPGSNRLFVGEHAG